MIKHKKLIFEDPRDTNLIIQEKTLVDQQYAFPSVDSLTNLNSTKIPHSGILTTSKSLRNLDSSYILD